MTGWICTRPFPIRRAAAARRIVQAVSRAGHRRVAGCGLNHLGPDGNYLAQYVPISPIAIDPIGAGDQLRWAAQRSGVRRLRFVIDNALMCCGLWDSTACASTRSTPFSVSDAVHVLEELAIAVRELGAKLGRSFVLIAESDLNDPRLVWPASRAATSGCALGDDLHHAVHRFFTGETDGYYADFRGPRRCGRGPPRGYGTRGSIAYPRGGTAGRPRGWVRIDRGDARRITIRSAIAHRESAMSCAGCAAAQRRSPALTVLSPFVPLL